MDFLLAFLEGMITFISPCLLPMLPVYVFYFAGAGDGSDGKSGAPLRQGAEGNGEKATGSTKVLIHALAFVFGFSLVFLLLGAGAGTLGGLLIRQQKAVRIIGGLLMILFGLRYLGFLPLGFLRLLLSPLRHALVSRAYSLPITSGQ